MVWSAHRCSGEKTKVIKYTKSPVAKIPLAKGRFEHIHSDILCPPLQSKGCIYTY